MVPDAIFMVKFNTQSQKVWKFDLCAHNFGQGCQNVDTDVSLDRSIQYLCNEVLLDDSGRHFHKEI